MKKIWIGMLLAVIALGGCHPPRADSHQRTVLVSIAPYVFFVQRIAENTVHIRTLIPEEANPHIYEPKPKEVERIRSANLWVRLGESFDQKVYKVLREQNSKMAIVDVTKGVDLIPSCEEKDLTGKHSHCHADDEGKDIHIWLSPKLAKVQAMTICEALVSAFPEHQELYQKNLQTLLAHLDKLDAEITAMLAPKKGNAILVSHPAFAYFCRDYGLIQLSVEMEGKDPLPQQITKLLEEAKKYHVTAVILEPQYSNKGAQLIAHKLDIPVQTIDPYAQDYLDNLRLIAQTIAK